jgi:iron complex outermembrane receptor protein
VKLGNYTDLKVVLNEEFHFAQSDYYENDEMQYTGSLTFSAERKKGKWFGAAILLREKLDGLKFLSPDFSAGCEIRTIPGEEHYLKLNVSRNSKIPSFNDRFWNPGGNRDLENEYAYSFEAGYKLDHTTGSALSFGSEINYFNNYIRNMIQWYPQTEFIWVTGNIGSANTSGIEASASLKYNPGSFSLNLNAGYSYTRAKDISAEEISDKQLIYIPLHKANGTLQVSYRNLSSSWITSLTGRTYTTPDNSSYLDNYLVNSVSGGYKLNFNEHSADIRLKIENIFNVSYQTIAYYPQPGRTYFLVLSLRFKA